MDINTFPAVIESWTSENIPISEYDLAILETRNAFIRKYTSPEGKSIFLFIVYSQNNRKVSHPPEICYTGSGATIVSSAHDSIPASGAILSIQVNKLAVEKGPQKQVVFYWFKVGDTMTSNYWKQQSLIAIKSFTGEPASSALIRISMDADNENISPVTQDLKEFGQHILPYLFSYLP